MPNRIFRDGFVDSEAVNALSDWSHRLYSNLLVRCDDAGRFDGRIEYIRSHLFPLGTGHRIEDFHKAIGELSGQRLIIQYSFSEKPYIQITKWQRCGKAERSKFPWTNGSFAIEYVTRETRDGEKEFVASSLIDPVSIPLSPHEDRVQAESNTKTETETKTKACAEPEGFLLFWDAYPKAHRVDRKACLRKWRQENLEPIAKAIVEGLEQWAISDRWAKGFVTNSTTFLNQRRWESVPEPAEPSGGIENVRAATAEDAALAYGGGGE